jgi:hypothetical protein
VYILENIRVTLGKIINKTSNIRNESSAEVLVAFAVVVLVAAVVIAAVFVCNY